MIIIGSRKAVGAKEMAKGERANSRGGSRLVNWLLSRLVNRVDRLTYQLTSYRLTSHANRHTNTTLTTLAIRFGTRAASSDCPKTKKLIAVR